jgi:hypothetical protein
MHRAELKDVLGKPFGYFVVEESRENLLKAYWEIVDGRPGPGPVQYILDKEFRDKAYREVRARLADLGDGPVLIGICRDISKRVSMEAKAQEKNLKIIERYPRITSPIEADSAKLESDINELKKINEPRYSRGFKHPKIAKL